MRGFGGGCHGPRTTTMHQRCPTRCPPTTLVSRTTPSAYITPTALTNRARAGVRVSAARAQRGAAAGVVGVHFARHSRVRPSPSMPRKLLKRNYKRRFQRRAAVHRWVGRALVSLGRGTGPRPPPSCRTYRRPPSARRSRAVSLRCRHWRRDDAAAAGRGSSSNGAASTWSGKYDPIVTRTTRWTSVTASDTPRRSYRPRHHY